MSIMEEAMEQAALRAQERDDRIDALSKEIARLKSERDLLKANNTKLFILLEEVRETIDNFVDVEDGPPGYEHEQKPNWAMSLTQEIDELIGKD